MTRLIGITAVFLFVIESTVNGWVWECVQKTELCERRNGIDSDEVNFFSSIEICRLVCGSDGNVWPKPHNFTRINRKLVFIDPKNTVFSFTAPDSNSSTYLQTISSYFKNVTNINDQHDCKKNVYKLFINLKSDRATLKLNWNTDEEYNLLIMTNDNARTVTVDITAVTVFGARHGIETLIQMIELYEDYEQTCYVTSKGVQIFDKPFYKHRGLLLDSARNYLSVDVIKKNIVAMAMSKMNVLHWHLSDTQSFPFMSSSLPNMSRYGAYSIKEVYTPYQIKDLIYFAKQHGVRIIPEIDGPSHTGNGWQWGPEAGLGNLIVCHNQQPWRSYCIQPPCGQMNPANPALYSVLMKLYSDIVSLWTESDVFHMGGDEVYLPCWNSSEEILNYIGQDRTERAFLNLWREFQEKALNAYDAAYRNDRSTIILWTSRLTRPEHIESYLPKDSWYLDHGFWGATTYYKWRDAYDNTILTDPAVLGGEVCMWGELVNDHNVESRVWPRAAAAAERLWTNPTTSSTEAEPRFYSHNSRLIERGIRASAVAPKFCTQSDSECNDYLRQRYYTG